MNDSVITLFTMPVYEDEPVAKAEQLGLFDSPTLVGAYTRTDGTTVDPHIAIRRKRADAGGVKVSASAKDIATAARKKHGDEVASAAVPAARKLAHADGAAEVTAAHMAEAVQYASDPKALSTVEAHDDTRSAHAAARAKTAGFDVDMRAHDMAAEISRHVHGHPHQAIVSRVARMLMPGGERLSAEQLAPLHAAVTSAASDGGLDGQKLLENLKHMVSAAASADGQAAAEPSTAVAEPDAPAVPIDEPAPASMADSADSSERRVAVEAFIAKNGGREEFRESLKRAGPDLADAMVMKLAEASGRSVDDMLEHLGVRRLVTPKGEPAQPKAKDRAGYQYADTGHIPGARKETAADMIRRRARGGERIRYSDIDWTELEENPREAAATITKGNLFGAVDWQALGEAGANPAAAFLIDRTYASVAAKPEAEQALRDYAYGTDSLRERMEKCRSVDDVVNLLAEVREERDGVILTAEESKTYSELAARIQTEYVKVRQLKDEDRAISDRWQQANARVSSLQYDIAKRERKKWKADPELESQLKTALEAQGVAEKEFMDSRDTHRHSKYQWPDGGTSYVAAYEMDLMGMQGEQRQMKTAIVARNRVENPVTRAWLALGEGFNKVLDYRGHKGSEAFARHVATARAGRIENWDWAEKELAPRQVTKQSAKFQLEVADSHERIGGRQVKVNSTVALKQLFNLRDVQSGNWVLDDYNSAKFHVESCASAFSDLADLLGVTDDVISFNGRLGMAFGARGRGGKGAAKAHYEPVQRVINITKMAGGGSLAHEWFHFVDNLAAEAVTGAPTPAETYATEDPTTLPAGALQEAFRDVVDAMTAGSIREREVLTYSAAEEAWAKSNMRGYISGSGWRATIQQATSAQDAADQIRKMYEDGKFGPPGKAKARDTWKQVRKIALITKGGNDARTIEFDVGEPASSYLAEARKIDAQDNRSYWSTKLELGARAFSAFVQDKLEATGRRNDYLVSNTTNDAYKALGMLEKPFPEGEERERINAAFERLFAVIRDQDVLQKAATVIEPTSWMRRAWDFLTRGTADVQA